MVQTEDQYVFIHLALLDYMESGETEVEANELRDYIRRHTQTEQKTGIYLCYRIFLLHIMHSKIGFWNVVFIQLYLFYKV